MHQLIITRILKRGEVTLSDLEHRATERGVSLSELYAALEHVHKDKRISVTNLKSGVTYRPAVSKAAPTPPKRPDYPRERLGESPFKVCSCSWRRIHWHPKMGHFDWCDAIKHATEYRKQNPWDATAGVLIDKKEYERAVNSMRYTRGNGKQGKRSPKVNT